MIGIEGQPVLTATEMRAAEEAVIATGVSVETLMDRAGAAIAEAVWRFAAGAPTLILCGPGNNGGDGYVAARILRARGVAVTVAVQGAARSEAASKGATACHLLSSPRLICPPCAAASPAALAAA